jgi:hypothetical protein
MSHGSDLQGQKSQITCRGTGFCTREEMKLPVPRQHFAEGKKSNHLPHSNILQRERRQITCRGVGFCRSEEVELPVPRQHFAEAVESSTCRGQDFAEVNK